MRVQEFEGRLAMVSMLALVVMCFLVAVLQMANWLPPSVEHERLADDIPPHGANAPEEARVAYAMYQSVSDRSAT